MRKSVVTKGKPKSASQGKTKAAAQNQSKGKSKGGQKASAQNKAKGTANDQSKGASSNKAKSASKSPAADMASFPLNGAAAVVAIVALVLFQGGYYAGATCVISLIAVVAFAVMAALRKIPLACPVPALAYGVVAVLLLVSALTHGAGVGMLQEAAMWFAVSGVALLCGFATAREKRRVLRVLADAGIVLAAIGIVMFVGGLPVEGAVNAGRLMFTLQYANTAGLLFAVFAVLCLCSPDSQRRIAGIVPVVALFLTQSVGAVGVFVLALVALVVRQLRSDKKDPVVLIVAAVVLVSCVVACVVLGPRVAQAQQTFMERIIQMGDALGLLAANPLLGIGPDQWQFIYPSIQSAQYLAANVHCSYLQLGLDAGVLALLVMVALLVYGLWKLARRGEFAAFVCVAMVAVHAVFDFDFQFTAVLGLMALLMADYGEAADAAGKQAVFAFMQGGAGRALCWVLAALAVVASCAGVYLDLRVGALQAAAAQADADQVQALMESDQFLANDQRMQGFFSEALLAARDYQGLLDLTDAMEDTDGTVGFQRTIAFYQLERGQEALEVMKSTLHDYPYNSELYEAMRQLIVEGGFDAQFAEAFDVEVSRANELAASGRAAWLENQKRVELIGEVATA